jgi:glycosyltransferase 2 family protein
MGEGAHGFQVFASASDAPRVRRATDLVALVVESALLASLIAIAGNGGSFDRAWADLARGLPGPLLWVGQALYLLAIGYAAGLLLGVGLFARGRLELLRDVLLAAALAVGGAIVLTRIVDDRWPALSVVDLDHPVTTFPAFFVTAATALQAAAGPHLSAPMRKLGWFSVLAGAAASLLGGVTQPSDVVGALLTGLIAAAIVRYVLRTSAGLPSLGRVSQALEGLGLPVQDLAYAPEQIASSALFTGASGDTRVLARVLGRDAWDNRLWPVVWRRAWYQDDGTRYGSTRREQVEHEALAMLLASRGGVRVPELLAVGTSAQDDGVIAVHASDGTTLADGSPDAIGDDLLADAWNQVRMLHEAGLSHGRLAAQHLWVDGAGAVLLADFSAATVSADDRRCNGDVVELLVATAVLTGPDRAIAAARAALGDKTLLAALPLLQAAALSSSTRREARKAKLKPDDLRKQVAADLGADEPELEKLQRVSLSNVLIVVLSGVAVYTLISQLADVGFSNIVDALSSSRWGLIVVAVVIVQITNVTDAIKLSVCSPRPVPVGVVAIEQAAIGFVNLAVPSAVGRAAVNIRFFQRFGVSAVASSTTDVLSGLTGSLAQALLLGLTILAGKGSIDLSDLQTDSGVLRLLGLFVVIFLVGLVVVLAVPRLRRAILGKLRDPIEQVKLSLATLRHPRTAAVALGASVGTQLLFAAGLALCVAAVGGSVSLGEALFINIVVSLFAGLMPIPGGIGVAEAGLTAGLTAVGVPSDTAVAAVLVYRLCSYYLPPTWGWFCLSWLKRHEYL